MNSVKITQNFADYINSSLLKKPEYTGVYITMLKEGSCGLSYKVKLYNKNKITPEDAVNFDENGFDLLIEKKILPLIENCEIDYISGIKSGIVFNNPNAKKSCGCGSAFKFDKEINISKNDNNKCA